jgi:hypothetical protein
MKRCSRKRLQHVVCAVLTGVACVFGYSNLQFMNFSVRVWQERFLFLEIEIGAGTEWKHQSKR